MRPRGTREGRRSQRAGDGHAQAARGGVSAQEMAVHKQRVGTGRGKKSARAGDGRARTARGAREGGGSPLGERGGGRAAEEQRREERTAVRGQEATRADRGRVVGGVRAAAGKEPGLAV